jgi:hypothetical protein
MGKDYTEAEMEAFYKAGEEARRATPHAVAVSYNSAAQIYTLSMLAGGVLSFTVSQVPEIAGATPEQLANVELWPSGGSIRWPQLDMDISITGLVMDIVAGEGWRAAYRSILLQEARATKTPKRAAAARENGLKGGRPRKRDAVAETVPVKAIRVKE